MSFEKGEGVQPSEMSVKLEEKERADEKSDSFPNRNAPPIPTVGIF